MKRYNASGSAGVIDEGDAGEDLLGEDEPEAKKVKGKNVYGD